MGAEKLPNFISSAGQPGQLQQYEAEIQYEEGYEDYGQYDTVGVVMDGAQGHDASKGEILYIISRVGDMVVSCPPWFS